MYVESEKSPLKLIDPYMGEPLTGEREVPRVRCDPRFGNSLQFSSTLGTLLGHTTTVDSCCKGGSGDTRLNDPDKGIQTGSLPEEKGTDLRPVNITVP